MCSLHRENLKSSENAKQSVVHLPACLEPEFVDGYLSSRNRRVWSGSRFRPADELCPRVVAGLLAFAASSADIVTPVLLADNCGSASSLSRNILGAPGFYQVVVVLAFQLLVDVVAHGCYSVRSVKGFGSYRWRERLQSCHDGGRRQEIGYCR